jgi:hypothetical protein
LGKTGFQTGAAQRASVKSAIIFQIDQIVHSEQELLRRLQSRVPKTDNFLPVLTAERWVEVLE